MMGSERSDDGTHAQGDRAAAPAAGHLALLHAWLAFAGNAPPSAPPVPAARRVSAADRAGALRDDGDVLRCVATDPEQADVQRGPASPALMQAARSRVLVLAADKPGDDRALLPP